MSRQHTAGQILVPINAHSDQGRGVICVPHAGAGASTFFPLGKALTVQGWAARFPGRESRIRERPLSAIPEMADHLADAVRHLDTDELTLFGHCCGALVAYELALRLQDWCTGSRRISLVASACAAPSWREEPSGTYRSVADMSDDELIDMLASLNRTDQALLRHSGFAQLMLPIYRADVLAVERYEPRVIKEVLHIPVLVLSGRDDKEVPNPAYRAWSQITDGCFKLKQLDGGHFYLDGQETVVAELIQHTFPSDCK